MTQTTLGKPSSNLAATVYMDVFPEKEGGYSVLCRNWDGVHTCGDTIAHCYEMAKDVVQLMWEVRQELGSTPPCAAVPPKPKKASHTFVFEITG